MEFHKKVLKFADSLINLIVSIILVIAVAYSSFCLWDNNQVYQSASNVQADMLKIKPVIKEDKPSFEELLKINSDVCAWITVDNTNIDYPVVQGENNLSYINTDVYGKFALAGSIYLDSRCDKYFRNNYSLLYGHHMANSNMFGDLDLFKDPSFFAANKTGKLITLNRVYNLEIYACILVNSSSDLIFDTPLVQENIYEMHNYALDHAVNIDTDKVYSLMWNPNAKIIALSTCSYEFTDARTIVLAVMK